MMIQELATAYKDVDVDTLDVIAAVLQWRRNAPSQQNADVPEVWRRLKTLLKQEDEVSSAESTRLALLDETSRLICQRKEIREEIERRKQGNEEIQTEINALQREKEKLEELKLDYADLEKQKANVQKERDEMRRKCRETQQIVSDGQRSDWLKPEVKSDIQRIWRSLPQDTLNVFLEE